MRIAPRRQLWFATQLVDYTGCALMAYNTYFFDVSDEECTPTKVAIAMSIMGAVSTIILYLRERVHFWLLHQFRSTVSPLPSGKDVPLTTKNLRYIFQTYAFSQISFVSLRIMNRVHQNQYEMTLAFWATNFFHFYLILILRDVCFLKIFHDRMHNDWYYFHKTHHENSKTVQAMHAFHIDPRDLVIENVGAPFLLLVLQTITAQRVGFHWLVVCLLTCHDASLHSVNPYSAMYFNPVLDGIFKGNLCHQLHHALNKGYLLFVPYNHIFMDQRKHDIDTYNKTFRTKYQF